MHRRIVQSLQLPDGALVNQRVPKKLLLEQGAPTAADKRLLQAGVEELHWLAALKPATIGVPAYRDDVREYLEIAVLSVELRVEAKPARLTELIHRAIPYPLLLMTLHAGNAALSLAHKRWSQAENQAVVLDGAVVLAPLAAADPSAQDLAFQASLGLGNQSASDLFALYQGWVDRAEALAAGALTGAFVLPATPADAQARREALQEHAQLQREIRDLRAKAAREKQMRDLVELNLTIRALEARLTAATARL
ncbi:MAG: DUF4391 domain-containing protein [Rhodoferax sp.]